MAQHLEALLLNPSWIGRKVSFVWPPIGSAETPSVVEGALVDYGVLKSGAVRIFVSGDTYDVPPTATITYGSLDPLEED